MTSGNGISKGLGLVAGVLTSAFLMGAGCHGDPVAGKVIYEGVGGCTVCHGINGGGEAETGFVGATDFVTPGYRLDTDGDTVVGTEFDLINVVTLGAGFYGGDPNMTAQFQLTATQIIDVVQYVLAFEAAEPDTDVDGVADSADNCVEMPNGPSAGPNNQVDVDGDGFGNVCDGDFNQDGFVGGPDFNIFLQCFNMSIGESVGPPEDPNCEESDMSGDAFVGGPDFDLFVQGFNGPPGP